MEIRTELARTTLIRRLRGLYIGDKLSFSFVFGDVRKGENIIVEQIDIFKCNNYFHMDVCTRELDLKTFNKANIYELLCGYKYEISEMGIFELVNDTFEDIGEHIFMDMVSVAISGTSIETLRLRIKTLIDFMSWPTIPNYIVELMYMGIYADRLPRIESLSLLAERATNQLDKFEIEQVEKENKVVRFKIKNIVSL